jgi:hypothetical protein
VNLGHLLLRLWEIVDAATLRSDLSKIYHSFVETIFHSAVIEGALENESLREAISTVNISDHEPKKKTININYRFQWILLN